MKTCIFHHHPTNTPYEGKKISTVNQLRNMEEKSKSPIKERYLILETPHTPPPGTISFHEIKMTRLFLIFCAIRERETRFILSFEKGGENSFTVNLSQADCTKPFPSSVSAPKLIGSKCLFAAAPHSTLY